jgi:hypothetical protein
MIEVVMMSKSIPAQNELEQGHQYLKIRRGPALHDGSAGRGGVGYLTGISPRSMRDGFWGSCLRRRHYLGQTWEDFRLALFCIVVSLQIPCSGSAVT